MTYSRLNFFFGKNCSGKTRFLVNLAESYPIEDTVYKPAYRDNGFVYPEAKHWFAKLGFDVNTNFFEISDAYTRLASILNASVLKRKYSFVEQPELGMHPAIQVELGDFFIEMSARRQVFIETHSEHIILRVLRRIRETTENVVNPTLALTPEDIRVFYMVEGKPQRLHVDFDGEFIDRWPDGFFTERANELF